jgi:hypothetical protein
MAAPRRLVLWRPKPDNGYSVLGRAHDLVVLARQSFWRRQCLMLRCLPSIMCLRALDHL